MPEQGLAIDNVGFSIVSRKVAFGPLNRISLEASCSREKGNFNAHRATKGLL